jgi:hypothetical protein
MRFIERRRLVLVLLLLLELFIVLRFVVPFLSQEEPFNWDFFGHYSSAYHIKNNIFPSPMGWNPFFFLGYPQNQFYPPLLSYSTALLGFVLPLDLVLILITILSALAVPPAFYYLLRRYSFSDLQAISGVLILVALLSFNLSEVFSPESLMLGYTFQSTFHIGLLTNSLALPLLVLYMLLVRELKDGYVKPSIMLSLVILCNVFVAVVAFVYLLAFVVSERLYREKNLYIHLALAFLLSAFWTIPFLAKFSFSRGTSTFQRLDMALSLRILLAAGLVIVLFRRRDKKMLTLHLSLVFLSLLILASFFADLPLHTNRLIVPVIMFLIPVVLATVGERRILLPATVVFFIILAVLSPGLEVPEGGRANLNIGKLDGRVLFVSPFDDINRPHEVDEKIFIETGNTGVNGLFLESAANGWYIHSIMAEIYPDVLIWGFTDYPQFIYDRHGINETGGYVEDMYENKTVNNIIRGQMGLFNVNYLLTNLNLSLYLPVNYTRLGVGAEAGGIRYYLYKIGESSLIDVLTYKPERVVEDWDEEAKKWFFSENISRVFVHSKDPLPDYVGTGDEEIRVAKDDLTHGYLKFEVDSQGPVPILVKISEFPNWEAYVNGERTRIYRASPYLMLVYGQGTIELKYGMVSSDIIGWLASLVGFIWVILFFVRGRSIP